MATFFNFLAKMFKKAPPEKKEPETLPTKKSHKPFKLADFEILNTLGKGTFGRVRLVKTFGGESTLYALKAMKKNEIMRHKQFDHIFSEVTLLNIFNNPFIVNMVSHFQDENRLYVLLEFISGGELFRLLRKNEKFTNPQAMFYAAEITLALSYLHSMKIMYRDLKPENVLLETSGHIKLVDFGLAKVITDRTFTLCGTAEYLAPEMIENKGHGLGVDWWALGILVYEMLHGRPPFHAHTPFEVYKLICHKPKPKIAYNPDCDVKATALIGKLLNPDRRKRLGCGTGGVKDVKKDKWFGGIDWENVANRQIEVPFLPKKPTVAATDTRDNDNDDDNDNDNYNDSGTVEAITVNFDYYPDSDEDVAIPLNGKERELFSKFNNI